GNRMVSLISRSSKGVGMRDYIKTLPELKYLEEKTFAQGDIIKTLITCENGELIELTLDTTLPRYYSRELTVRGTQGFYSMDNNSVFLNSDIVSQGETLDRANIKDLFKNSEKKYYKYLPSDWKNVTEEIIQAGHGGMDYFEFKAFADCLLSGKEMPIDVYDAVAWMCITYLSERSLKTGMAQEIPDFTNGKYKARLPKDVMDFPRIEE
ncbi:MAG: gfo/Idh/MocA family oxidoreductase, partial [Clostridia bacterium]|nr:gfo/Idh/MocA family oxidoreductase [Clostridia bacterium]